MPNVKAIDAAAWAALPEIPLVEGEDLATKGLSSDTYRLIRSDVASAAVTQWAGVGPESASEVGSPAEAATNTVQGASFDGTTYYLRDVDDWAGTVGATKGRFYAVQFRFNGSLPNGTLQGQQNNANAYGIKNTADDLLYRIYDGSQAQNFPVGTDQLIVDVVHTALLSLKDNEDGTFVIKCDIWNGTTWASHDSGALAGTPAFATNNPFAVGANPGLSGTEEDFFVGDMWRAAMWDFPTGVAVPDTTSATVRAYFENGGVVTDPTIAQNGITGGTLVYDKYDRWSTGDFDSDLAKTVFDEFVAATPL